ncbi:hypothetical protein [Telluribacter humicola]|uniref:hypothetical protein n=1 Tax=Telluribacter humicola TaxID=1720261 RepID=UPI001A9590AB|nr:hypothetical protein [Telluribacter humicola]
MKQLLSIGLLLLLLLNILGQSVAVLCIEEMYSTSDKGRLGDEWVVLKVPLSIPYGTAWQNDDPSGLIQYNGNFYNIVEQRYENDSLYTVLRSNLSAREQFFAIADQLQQQLGQDTEKSNPVEKTAKLLSGALKHYLPAKYNVTLFWWELAPENSLVPATQSLVASSVSTPLSPPPELV